MDGPINLPHDATAAQVAAEVARVADDVRREIAEQLCAMSGAHLYCTRCQTEFALTVERSLYYVSHGWPKHCRRTMEIRTRRTK